MMIDPFRTHSVQIPYTGPLSGLAETESRQSSDGTCATKRQESHRLETWLRGRWRGHER